MPVTLIIARSVGAARSYIPHLFAQFDTPGHAVSHLAILWTKLRVQFEREHGAGSYPKEFATSLKNARDLRTYDRSVDHEWVFEDENLSATIIFEHGHAHRGERSVFLDSDGVFAHFEHQVEATTGETIAQLGDDRMWALCGGNADFWQTMPVMDGSRDLWNALLHLKPTVLTGCPKTDFDLAAEEKRVWWKKHFDHEDVITCLSKDKALFCTVGGDVLIDDTYRNIKRWREAGGIGILHKNVEGTLDELHNLLIIE